MMAKCPLLIVAGWGHPASALAGLCRALAPDIPAIPTSTHDLAMHGSPGCAAGDTVSLSRYAAGLAAMIRRQGGKASLVGWSLGGMAALEVAAAQPELIERLALVASTAKFCTGADFACGIPEPNVRAMRAGLRRDPAAVLAGFYRLAAEPFPAPAPALSVPAADWREELAAGLDYLAKMDLRHCLEKVRASPLILHGREDRVIPWPAAEYLARELRGSRLRLYAGIGHDLPRREASRLADDIREFLE